MGRALDDEVQPDSPDSVNNTIEWSVASNYKFASKEFKNFTTSKCITPTVGYDPNPYFHKQCFCEAPPRLKPRICAKENGTCECDGIAFYAAEKYPKTNKTADFNETMDMNYVWKNSTKEIKCNSDVFGDPAFGFKKQCYCDDVHFISREKLEADQVYYEEVVVYTSEEQRSVAE